MEIRLAKDSDLEDFFEYLDQHFTENGADSAPVFQPMSRDESKLNEAMKSKFCSGIRAEVGAQGWRKMLLAFDDNKVIGHIDIRSHPENHTNHRTLLGMGVDRSYRGNGVGGKLLLRMFEWAAKDTNIECIDLWVSDVNYFGRSASIRLADFLV